jgi:dTDP-4-dehydrorhamnose reductase
MKILITGAQGQLGLELMRLLSRQYHVIGLSKKDMNVAHIDEVYHAIQLHRPDTVIHAAAYTKVDQAERDWETAYQINAIGTRNVASAAEHIGAKLVCISTDYVFDGEKGSPYHEFDTPRPLSVYGRSKLEGERLVQSLHSRYFIVRTSWLYGKYGNNFVSTIIELAEKGGALSVTKNEWGTPTYTLDLADWLGQIITTEQYGIYHASNAGSCSRYEFATSILRLSGYRNQVKPVDRSTFRAAAARPKNSSLDHLGIRLNGLPHIRSWKEALSAYLINDLKIREKVNYFHD